MRQSWGKDLAALDAKATPSEWHPTWQQEQDLIVALRNNLPAILDALACKAATKQLWNQWTPGTSPPEPCPNIAEVLQLATEIRATWEQR